VGASLNQSGSYNSATLLLSSAGDFKTFKSSLASDPRFSIDLQRETDYYRNQSRQTTKFIRIFGGIVAFIMAFGAVFGALNSMYSVVRTRVTEIATLRAIGFDTGPILFSVIFEALLLSLVGGLIGAAVAWGIFNGYSVSTSGGSLSQVAFKLRIDGALVLIGIATALIIGLVGGFFPALHAGKAPVVEGLRGN
jgi:putative ABC transport system permease protein